MTRLLLASLLAAGLPALAQQRPDPKPAQKLTVTVPLDDAELTIEGQKMSATGTTRVFDLPPLEPGKKFVYQFVVKWRPNNYTEMTRPRTVEFTAGGDLTVDLTQDTGSEKAVIRWVPTPDDIVQEMLKLAKLAPTDVVYEPGCGDARIVTAAVKAGAKKGVGIDLDPEKVAEAKDAVKKAGLDGKVDIRLGDALDIKDLDQATVVFLYMGNEFDLLIRPSLWRQLKVGARVVSHRFLMGDWKPEKTVKVTGQDGDEYELHLWTVTEAEKRRADEVRPAAGAKPTDVR
jgi:uncharacterized protein (TIGR03000 family)